MEEERRLLIERKRNMLLLISQYLKDMGLFLTNTALEREALCNIKEYQICDNVDLDSIYLEYMSYYHLKFGKNPKIAKKCENVQQNQFKKSPSINLERQNSTSQKKCEDKKPKNEESNLTSSLVVVPMNGDKQFDFKDNEISVVRRRLSDCDFFMNTEWREMAEAITRDMVRAESSVIKWNEIVGHSHARDILTESTVLPLQYPDLFSSVGNGWKCTLLHGPPGTGKFCSETYTFTQMNGSTSL